jgi:SAM-dependent methyltransferase
VLDGFELSPPAAEIARARGVARRVEVFDGLDVPAEDGAYDLAVLSHVLEHVPEPMSLLREAMRVAPAVLIEVPLEDNRSARRDDKRAEAARIGHIQFFDRSAVHALVRVAGLRIAAELSDPLPYAHHAFFAETRGGRATAALKAGVRRAAWRVAPRVAERLFTVHYACLACR